ncbi:hypothetical protein [uncultured Shewanella sp.]|uniref:hypothetical protein n=1 Tax=uncultured Shewanella sp. TaxID=173975 RepID=UPI002639D070|nr:hypothetical protein [uncultured Shewanella sp.]
MRPALILFSLFIYMMCPSHALATNCNAPDALAGKRFVLEVDGQYTLNNPRAGELQRFTFKSDALAELSFHTGETLSGEYHYQVLAPDIGLFSTRLMQEDTLISEFELTLMCKNNTTGHYIFSQTAGSEPPAIRQNVGTYFIMKN